MNKNFGPDFEKKIQAEVESQVASAGEDKAHRVEIHVQGAPSAAHAMDDSDLEARVERLEKLLAERGAAAPRDNEENEATVELSAPAMAMPDRPAMPSMPASVFIVKTQGGSTDFDRVIQSLTAEQKSKIRQRGYLRGSDLSITQRGWLSLPAHGQYALSYSNGSKKLVVKSK